MGLLDKIPLLPLAIAAVMLALAPVRPQPHLWEKLNMLLQGALSKPIDIFDLFLHSGLLLLLLLKLVRMAQVKKT